MKHTNNILKMFFDLKDQRFFNSSISIEFELNLHFDADAEFPRPYIYYMCIVYVYATGSNGML